MASTAWGLILEDVVDRIRGAADGSPAGITPTVDPQLRWRCVDRGRPEGEAGRDREFVARRWTPAGDVQIFGGGEDQLSRDLALEIYYADAPPFEDRRHADEKDLIVALDKRSTYPSGSGWALRVRRVLRDQITVDDPEQGSIKVTIPVRLTWREAAAHL